MSFGRKGGELRGQRAIMYGMRYERGLVRRVMDGIVLA